MPQADGQRRKSTLVSTTILKGTFKYRPGLYKMCIRDRVQAGQEAQRRFEEAIRQGLTDGELETYSALTQKLLEHIDRLSPVSYTHLAGLYRHDLGCGRTC